TLWLGRLWNLRRNEPGHSTDLPEVFARRRAPGGFPGDPVHVQSGIRSERIRDIFRAATGRRKAAAGDDLESLLDAPADSRPHRGSAEGDSANIAGTRRVHCDDLGV